MRLIFVRHGEPDYERDCLTPRGRLQAEAAARRLEREGVTAIYTSPNGRAGETASFTARLLNLPVTTLDYMHEVSWGGQGIPAEGHPWTLSDWLLDRENYDFSASDWRAHPYFRNNAVLDYECRITAAFDALLAEHGYTHCGRRYLCAAAEEETLAVFSHGGSGACVLSHLLSLPFPYVASVMTYDFTSVTILSLPVRTGEYVHVHLDLFNDAAHIRGLSDGLKLQQVSE